MQERLRQDSHQIIMTEDLQKAIEISIINEIEKLINLNNDLQMVQQFMI